MTVPSPRKLRAVYRNMDDAFLQCRDLGHDFPKKAPAHPVSGGWERTFTCHSCEVEKVQFINRRGYIEHSYLRNYPEGYLMIGMGYQDRDSKALMRLENIERNG